MRESLFLVVAALVGCRHAYREPAMTEPHAIVKLRVLHHATPGPNLSVDATIGEEVVRLAQDQVETTHLRVRPVPTDIGLRSVFSHTVPQARTRQVTESYPCGTGYGGVTRTCTRSRTETYTEHVTVVDARCESAVRFLPRVNAIYLVQYDFHGHEECSLKCFLQVPDGRGGFVLGAC